MHYTRTGQHIGHYERNFEEFKGHCSHCGVDFFQKKSSRKKKNKSAKKQKKESKLKKDVPKKAEAKRKYFHCDTDDH